MRGGQAKDDDGSGRISLEELTRGSREELGVRASELPEAKLHALCMPV